MAKSKPVNDPTEADSLGGSGGLSIRPRGRADTKLLERALKESWPIPDEYRELIVRRQVGIASDPESSPRESTSAARCLAAMSSENAAIALKLLDKVAPDLHEVSAENSQTRIDLDGLFENSDYVEFLRQRTRIEDCDAGAVCQIRESGHGHAMENGKAHGNTGPGTNGDREG